jgi:hypothetical protein
MSSQTPKSAQLAAPQILSMSVHGLPSAATASAQEGAQTRLGRVKMFMLLAVCIAPVAASYFSYYVWRPEGLRNYGELIQPQRAMPSVLVQTPTTQSINLHALKGQWLLVSVAGGECDAQCEQHLYVQRQIREALGKEKTRLDWVWVVDDAQIVRSDLATGLQSAQVVRMGRATLQAWLQASPGQRLRDHLYLLDPLGNWMMRFPAQADASKVKRDIERLLRASASWDRPGREAEIVQLQSAAPPPAARDTPQQEEVK